MNHTAPCTPPNEKRKVVKVVEQSPDVVSDGIFVLSAVVGEITFQDPLYGEVWML